MMKQRKVRITVTKRDGTTVTWTQPTKSRLDARRSARNLLKDRARKITIKKV